MTVMRDHEGPFHPSPVSSGDPSFGGGNAPSVRVVSPVPARASIGDTVRFPLGRERSCPANVPAASRRAGGRAVGVAVEAVQLAELRPGAFRVGTRESVGEEGQGGPQRGHLPGGWEGRRRGSRGSGWGRSGAK